MEAEFCLKLYIGNSVGMARLMGCLRSIRKEFPSFFRNYLSEQVEINIYLQKFRAIFLSWYPLTFLFPQINGYAF